MKQVMSEKHEAQLAEDVFVSIMDFIDEYAKENGAIAMDERFMILVNVSVDLIRHTIINILHNVDDGATPEEVNSTINLLVEGVYKNIRVDDPYQAMKDLRKKVTLHPEMLDRGHR